MNVLERAKMTPTGRVLTVRRVGCGGTGREHANDEPQRLGQPLGLVAMPEEGFNARHADYDFSAGAWD